jgi:hypothetical protein
MPNLSVPDDDPQRPLPRRQPSYIHFTPRRAMQSFDNLVALANHAERLKDARRIVWRDRGEPVVELRDLQGCLLHAGKGAVRAWPIRAGQSGRPKTDRLIRLRRGKPCVRHSRRCQPLSAAIQAQAHAPVRIQYLDFDRLLFTLTQQTPPLLPHPACCLWTRHLAFLCHARFVV